MLARHGKELKALNAEQTEMDAMEQGH